MAGLIAAAMQHLTNTSSSCSRVVGGQTLQMVGSPPSSSPPPPPHALVLPLPAQGHVIPLIELSHCLVDRGFEITFVNTEFNHDRVVAALSENNKDGGVGIHLVSIPDGLGPGDDRNDLGRLTDGLLKVMPGCLEDIIRKTNEESRDGYKITCMIADLAMAWALAIAKKTGLRSSIFCPAAAGMLAITVSVPKLIDDEIIDTEGVVKKKGMIELSPGIPPFNTNHLPWNCIGDSKTGRTIFNYGVINNQATEIAEFIICNSFYEIEQPVFAYAPKILPVGPLLTGLRFEKPVGHFWPEDSSCTAWLDEQPSSSVIYVAFGSFTIFDQRQFHELALGLELTGRRFLWVVRPNLTDGTNDAYPDGFGERVAGRGRMVGWSPQQQVLAHPSIACFVSHCGWNSIMEGVRNGVPFLCWPYFADQFFNQSYICDVWRTGLSMSPDENGIISKEQIRSKVEELLADDELKARALALKEMADRSVVVGGSSFKNLNDFADAMK